MSGHLVCIGSLPASGKTTIANRLSAIMNSSTRCERHVVSLCPDKIRLKILGKDPETDVLTDKDITRETTQQVISQMKQQSEESLRQGKTVIIGSSFILANMRVDYEKSAKNLGANFSGFWLDAGYEVRKNRALNRAQEDGAGSKIVSDTHLMAKIEGDIDWCIIDAERPVEVIVQEVCESMNYGLA